MKYALINTGNLVLDVSEDESDLYTGDQSYSIVEISDDQFEQFDNSTTALFLLDGVFVTSKEKRWAENPELVKESFRLKRNRLLAASDWTQLNDTSLTEETIAAWTAYRQALRDITDNIDESGEVEFPVAP